MIPELAELLKCSIEQTLEDEVAVSFSGGIDSSLIAHIAKSHSKVHLFTTGTQNSKDLEMARLVAKELNLELNEIIFTKESILEYYKEVYEITKAGLLKVEILIPFYAAAKAAKEKGVDVILAGSGSEELFVGYNRYYTYFNEGKDLDKILQDEFKNLPKGDIGGVNKVARSLKIEARFPFMNKKLADFIFKIPVEKRMEDEELKKGLLREASKLLKLPDIVRLRKKKAAQYGSGIHKILMKNSKFINENYPKS